MTTSQAIRVLHVLGSMNRGGVETWLMHVLRHINRERFQMGFCCLSGEPGVYAPEVEALGSKVYSCRLTKNLLEFNRQFDHILTMGHYDVVHSHVHHFSGYILWRAAKRRIRQRIAHSFTAPPEENASFLRRLYKVLMKRWIHRYATLGLGNSQESMCSLFGESWQHDARWQLLYCGIDLVPFERLGDVSSVRSQYGIPQDAAVIGHLGRLTPAKNHRFLIEIAKEINKRRDDVWFLLVGDGPLRQQLQEYVRQQGLTKMIFTGAVADIEPYLRSMDLFLFPSLWEGLPQSVIEAQSAGLRCLCSEAVTREVAVVPDAVRFLPLSESVSAWAGTCLAMAGERKIDPCYALRKVADSPFAIEKSVEKLACLYTGISS